MKIKLLFLIVIVLSMGCSQKTHEGVDYQYYRAKMEKANKLQQQNYNVMEKNVSAVIKEDTNSSLSKEDRIRFANTLGIPEKNITNDKLYNTIDDWLGVPYLWGGNSKKGVDCSAFVQEVYQKVYQKELPRTSIEQFYMDTKAHFQDQQYLKEGDLIFFRLRHKDRVVSHVGIYLQNGKFLGSNSPRGVEIADLNSNYWQDKYVASSRLLNN